MSAREVVLLDGGVGQEIYTRAGKPDAALWSVEVMRKRPEIVKEVHRDFIKAGASVITINTYTATPGRLQKHGILDEFEKIQREAFDIAASAVAESGKTREEVAVAACLPPLFASYRVDPRPEEELMAEYEQITQLQAESVDLFLIETISSIREAKAAVTVASKYGKPVWLSFTLSDTEDGKLRSGETIEEALKELEPTPIEAFLFCCSFPEAINQGIDVVSKTWNRKFGGYANLFKSIEKLKDSTSANTLDKRCDIRVQQYTSFVADWVSKGASIVGGCCEITPDFIEDIHTKLKQEGYKIVPKFTK